MNDVTVPVIEISGRLGIKGAYFPKLNLIRTHTKSKSRGDILLMRVKYKYGFFPAISILREGLMAISDLLFVEGGASHH